MKVIALLQFKNEEWILPTYLSSIRQIADEIIAIDDGSTDKSRHIVEAAGGVVFDHDEKLMAGWPEYSLREKLLSLGRDRGGTHFICLDADEAFTAPFHHYCRELLKTLKPGQKIYLQWLALWKSPYYYRQDTSVWSNNFKDFAFCDDGKAKHDYAFVGVGRTPGPNEPPRLVVKPEFGAVLHFQFVPWERFQMKQAWYRCAELLNAPQDMANINSKYAITLDDPAAATTPIPSAWLSGIEIPAGIETLPPAWHQDEILGWFEKYGIEYFEPLQIWHIPQLAKEFQGRVGRAPQMKLG